MAHPVGRRLPVSLSRRFIGDLIHFAARVPLSTMQRTMHLAAVRDAREQAWPRPGWCALFVKAYALVALRRPPLRWAYIPWPRPHFYEHPANVACVGIERRLGDEDAVFFTHVRGPEDQSLSFIEAHLRRCKEEPVESIPLFRRILYTSRLPRPLRRLLWWLGLNVSGHRRARYMGTFGVSVVAALGGAGTSLLTPVTTGLTYGVLADDGSLDVRLTYDHRVLDGGTAARALADLEEVLHGPILDELYDLQTGTGFRPRPGPRAAIGERQPSRPR
jgi:hypothetical protein